MDKAVKIIGFIVGVLISLYIIQQFGIECSWW
jgi:hypothetical protein